MKKSNSLKDQDKHTLSFSDKLWYTAMLCFCIIAILFLLAAYIILTGVIAMGLSHGQHNEYILLLFQILCACMLLIPVFLSLTLNHGCLFGMNTLPFLCIILASISITVFVIKLETYFMTELIKFIPWIFKASSLKCIICDLISLFSK